MNEPTPHSRVLSRTSIWFAATFLWTWGLCAVLALGGLGSDTPLGGALLLLAMIGPGVTGIVFTRLTRTPAERRDYWRRVVDPRRLRWPWLAATVGIPFGLQFGAGLLDGLTGGVGPRWGEAAGAFLSDPATQILTLWIITLVPFFEEMGWRGYAQDRLMESMDAVRASLLLGLMWSLWHLPAFFVPGTYHAGLGIMSLEALLFFVGVVALGMVVSWIYLNTGRSILIMVLFHATVNLSGELITLSERGEVFFTLGWIGLAVAIVLGCGRTMKVALPRVRVASRAATTVLVVGLVGVAGAAGVASAVGAAGVASAVGATVVSTPPTPESPSTVAPSLRSSAAELTAVLEEVRSAHELPGITAAYSLPDGRIVTAACGRADVERNVPMRPDTPMLAASIGKSFVAATAAGLADEGLLDLDAPVARWLGDRPWFDRLPNARRLTLRHLLQHGAGVIDHVHDERFQTAFAQEWNDPDADRSVERWIALALDREPLFAPGAGFAYSDTGYLLAALVLEEATGRTWTDLVSERFLVPLGLEDTRPSDHRDLPGLACGYLGDDAPFGLPPRTLDDRGVMVWDPAIEGAGGGFASTARDLVVWGRWAFTEGPARPDRHPTVPIDGGPGRYGLGVALRPDGPFGPVVGHAGWIPGTVSSLRVHPDRGIAVAFQINTSDGADEAVAELETRLAELAASEVERVAGPTHRSGPER